MMKRYIYSEVRRPFGGGEVKKTGPLEVVDIVKHSAGRYTDSEFNPVWGETLVK